MCSVRGKGLVYATACHSENRGRQPARLRIKMTEKTQGMFHVKHTLSYKQTNQYATPQ